MKNNSKKSRKYVPVLNTLLQLEIVISETLSILDHLFNVFRGQPVLVVGDGDLLLVAGALVFSGNLEDAVSVNFESDLDLWNTTGCWRDSGQVEFAQAEIKIIN